MKPYLSSLFIGASLFLSSIATAHDVKNGHATALPQKRLLPVTASAQFKAAPDKATISAGVVTEGKNASETASENAVKMTAVFDALTRANVPASDIRTSRLSLSPRYDYESRKKPRIVGYTANNLITVSTKDLNKVTPIIDALVQAGSNNVQNVKFSLSDPEALQGQVLEEAIKKARAKAQLIARSAGVSLGPIQSIDVGDRGYSPNSGNYDEVIVTASRKGGGSVSTPVSAGELTLNATVKLVYEMR